MKKFRVQSSEFRMLFFVVAVLAVVFFALPISTIYAEDTCPDNVAIDEWCGNAENPLYVGCSRENQCSDPSGLRQIDTCQPDLSIAKTFVADDACIDDPGSGNSTSSIKDIFGIVRPPAELNPFVAKGGSGAGGISAFINGLIGLIYIFASIVFTFMLLWGALQWTMSGGDKEAVAAARRRITYAFIGIILFAIAFAIIKVVGTFTGFKFTNQADQYYRDANGKCTREYSPANDGRYIYETAPDDKCQPLTP